MSLESGSGNNSDIDLESAKDVLNAEGTIPSKEAEAADCAAAQEEAHLNGLINFYFLRKKWSWFILGCISLLILFQIVLTILVGCSVLDFQAYNWFLSLVVSENFIQIIGLAIIVVNFLFDKKNGKGDNSEKQD